MERYMKIPGYKPNKEKQKVEFEKLINKLRLKSGLSDNEIKVWSSKYPDVKNLKELLEKIKS